MAKTSKNDKKKSNILLVCFWILVLVLIAVLFFVKRNDIKKNLDETNFFERVLGKTPAALIEKDKTESEKPTETIDIDLMGTKPGNYTEVTGTEANKTTPEEIQNVNTAVSNEEKPVVSETKKEETKTESKTEAKTEKTETASKETAKKEPETTSVPKKTEVTLYFITVDSDGSVIRKQIKRSLAKSDSPLTDSINTLLKGPDLAEQQKGIMTLIPEGTKLLGASVKNGTATLNFNDNFEFNSIGVEGYIAQLMQIVYTATEFSTVRNVQILIEGEKKDYLGSEGQWIGSPLARSSF